MTAAPVALTRAVSPRFDGCELTHLERRPIDVERAREQHRAYESRLRELGCEIRALPEEPHLPDSVFVEDTALVLEELAVVTRPGVASRRPETSSVAAALADYRSDVAHVEPPATLDGGDVLRIGRTLYVGRSRRTNPEGLAALARLTRSHGYRVIAVPIAGCLHLKSAVTRVAPDRLLVNPGWVDPAAFEGLAAIPVDPVEPAAANALLVGGTVVYPRAFPRTRRRLEQAAIRVRTVDVSELAKAEGGVTCCSLIFEP